MHSRTIRRRRATLALLVVLSITLLTVYFGESAGGGLYAIQRVVMGVLAPLQDGASRALKPARDTVNWVGDTFNAKGENKRLKSQLDQARGELARSQSAQRENRQLRGLVELRNDPEFPNGTQPVTARVIGRSPNVWYSTVTVSSGSSDGVRVDQPVINGEGLVGRVSATTGGTSQVTLITDHTSSVSAEVVPNGATGLVEPRVGDPTDLVLDFLRKARNISQDDTVVTAGWRSGDIGSLFPRGIPIGTVSKVGAGDRQVYGRVHVKPYADLTRLDVVQILTRPGRGARAQLGGAP